MAEERRLSPSSNAPAGAHRRVPRGPPPDRGAPFPCEPAKDVVGQLEHSWDLQRGGTCPAPLYSVGLIKGLAPAELFQLLKASSPQVKCWHPMG